MRLVPGPFTAVLLLLLLLQLDPINFTPINAQAQPEDTKQASNTSQLGVIKQLKVIELIGGGGQQAASSNTTRFRPRLSWRAMESILSLQLASFVQSILKPRVENSLKLVGSVSAECSGALMEMMDALSSDDFRNQRLWATAMLDSSGRLPSGLLSGSLSQLGNFDQCLSVGRGSFRGKSPSISSQYCSLLVKPPLASRLKLTTICQALPTEPAVASSMLGNESVWLHVSRNQRLFHQIGLRIGLCLPSKCQTQELQRLVTSFLHKFELVGQIKWCQASLQSDQQDTDIENFRFSNYSFDSIQLAVLGCLLTLVLLCILGTIFDLAREITIGGTSSNCKQFKSSQVNLDRSRRERLYLESSLTDSSSASSEGAGHQQLRGKPKRWQYEVYQEAGNQGGKDTAASCGDEFFAHFHRNLIYPQSNPLAKSLKQDQTEHTASDLDAEESWLERMEEPEAELDPTKAGRQSMKKNNCSFLKAIGSFLRCFSLVRNMSFLFCMNFSQRQSDRAQQLHVIHGIQSLSMIWIVFGQSMSLLNLENMNNSFELVERACNSRLIQALLNSSLAIDTFFVIGGLITTRNFIKRCPEAELRLFETAGKPHNQDPSSSTAASSIGPSASACKEQPQQARHQNTRATSKNVSIEPMKSQGRLAPDFKPLVWILARYWRLTPAYLCTIGLVILLPALGSGPLWPEAAAQLASGCRQNWWLNLLYVNNLALIDKLCLSQSWYLSSDFQFTLLAILLFAILFASKRLALILLISLFAASTATTFTITTVNQFPPSLLATAPANSERWLYLHALYYKPWPHLPAYLIGLLAGCFIQFGSYQDKRRQLHVEPDTEPSNNTSGSLRLLGWLLSSLVGLSLLNSLYPWNLGLQVEPILTAVHASTFRSLWASCIAWLVYASARNPESSLTQLLAWPGFKISSKLTYCAYLMFPIAIQLNLGQARDQLDSTMFGCLSRFIVHLSITYTLAACLALLVELPSGHLLNFRNSEPSEVEDQLARSGRQVLGERRLRGNKKSLRRNGSISEWSNHFEQTLYSSRESDLSQVDRSSGISASELASTTSGKLIATGSGKKIPSKPITDILHYCPSHGPVNITSEASEVAELRPPASIGTSSLDTDFQKRLAQAIGRGFKLRSRMVAENGNGQPNGSGCNQASRQATVKSRHLIPKRPVKSALIDDATSDQIGEFKDKLACPKHDTRIDQLQATPLRQVLGGRAQLSTFSSQHH